MSHIEALQERIEDLEDDAEQLSHDLEEMRRALAKAEDERDEARAERDEAQEEAADAEEIRAAVVAYLDHIHRASPSLTPDAWKMYEAQLREELIEALYPSPDNQENGTLGLLLYPRRAS